jgi:hypothetical protein
MFRTLKGSWWFLFCFNFDLTLWSDFCVLIGDDENVEDGHNYIKYM